MPFFLSLSLLQIQFGPPYLLYILFLVWANDIGAYFAGTFWGKTLLAPSISPHKTWEGVLGGLVLGSLVIILGGFLLNIHGIRWILWVTLNIVISLWSVIGDLFERSDKDDLVYPRIELNDNGSMAFDGSRSIKHGNYVRSCGLTTTLTDNTSTATAISHEVLDYDLLSGFTIEYSIKRGNAARTGVIKVAPDYSAGTTPSYTDDAAEYGTTGVTLSITQSSDKLYLKYTTTSTGTDARLTYSIVKYAI